MRCYGRRGNIGKTNFSNVTKKHLDGKERSAQVPPIIEDAKEFWNKLWDNPVPYKVDTEWLKEVELKLENVNIQENVEITKEDATVQQRKMPN